MRAVVTPFNRSFQGGDLQLNGNVNPETIITTLSLMSTSNLTVRELTPLIEGLTGHEKRAEVLTQLFLDAVANQNAPIVSYLKLKEAIRPPVLEGQNLTGQTIMGTFFAYPKALIEFLSSASKAWSGKTVAQTHTVIPLFDEISTVEDGVTIQVQRTLKNLDASEKSMGGKGFSRGELDAICKSYWWKDDLPKVKFEWGVVTNECLKSCNNTMYDYQEKNMTSLGYEVPNILDLATCLFWKARYSNEVLFKERNLRCKRTEIGPVVGLSLSMPFSGISISKVDHFRESRQENSYNAPWDKSEFPSDMVGIRKFAAE